MVTEAGKELLRNTINTAKFHNKIIEENEMWKQWELECGLTMMVSDDDVIKRIKSHQCSKHRRRDKSRSRDSSHSRHEVAKTRLTAGSSMDRWDHSGFAELYPDAVVPDEHPSTSVPTLNRHKKKKKEKSRPRSNSSDKEIWEEFKRTDGIWNKERVLKLIELLRNAPALWNKNYPWYKDELVKLSETKRISSKLNIDQEEILTQITFLVNEFHKEHQKITLKNLKGTCAKNSENEWFAYKHLTFLINYKNERYHKNIEGDDENPQWIDSSDSYSDSEDETLAQLPADKTKDIESKKLDGIGKEHEKEACKDLPCVQAYNARKDSFSVFGESVAHRMREANKSGKAIARAEKEIHFVLQKFETGFFDPPEDTFK